MPAETITQIQSAIDFSTIIPVIGTVVLAIAGVTIAIRSGALILHALRSGK